MLKLNFLSPTILVFLALLCGCSIMPAFGPSSDNIESAANSTEARGDNIIPFKLVELAPETLFKKPETTACEFSNDLTQQKYLQEDEIINSGDELEIRLWEAANDGLFASSGQRETTFKVTVTNSGYIAVPYAGRVSVASETTTKVREVLLSRYKGKAIDPEIQVRITKTAFRDISLIGAINKPGRYAVNSRGVRLLDLLAQAGGANQPDWETLLTVKRGNATASCALVDILTHKQNNVVVLPGDTIHADHRARYFSVYGAVHSPGNLQVNLAAPSLSDVLAESGGLRDLQAEPNSVFVFRQTTNGLTPEKTATAYRLDFAKADAFLLANNFSMQPRDVVYIATADASEFRKFVRTLLSPLLGGVSGFNALSN